MGICILKIGDNHLYTCVEAVPYATCTAMQATVQPRFTLVHMLGLNKLQ